MFASSLSKPPTPILSNVKSSLKILTTFCDVLFNLNAYYPALTENSRFVSSTNMPPKWNFNKSYLALSTPKLIVSVLVI